jgi:hypothetical protein
MICIIMIWNNPQLILNDAELMNDWVQTNFLVLEIILESIDLFWIDERFRIIEIKT